jgi:hypothetical protein
VRENERETETLVLGIKQGTRLFVRISYFLSVFTKDDPKTKIISNYNSSPIVLFRENLYPELLDSRRVSSAAEVKSALCSKLGRTLSMEMRARSNDGRVRSTGVLSPSVLVRSWVRPASSVDGRVRLVGVVV